MKFKKFIMYRIRAIGAYILCILIITTCLCLDDVRFQNLYYSLGLCISFGLFILIIDFIHYCNKAGELERIAKASIEGAVNLPSPSEAYEEEYQRIIKLILEEKNRSEFNMNHKYDDMIDYYSTWAHQIKTPIASMSLKLQNEDSKLSRELRNELSEIESYVEMVMAYLRLDSNDSDLVIKEIKLDDILRPAIRKFSGSFIRKGLKLSYEPVELMAISDEKWLSFVIEQVISNAIKYTNEGGISIYTERSILCIEDTGIGIAASDLPRVFEKGYTGFNGREYKKASGIGLYLCKNICDKLGHEILAESVPGKGTVIKINFGMRRLNFE